MANRFQILVDQILADPEQLLKRVELLSKAEKRRILTDFNNTETAHFNEKTIYRLFEEQVVKTPNQIAIGFEERQMTYRELNEKSNQLAGILRGKAVKPDQIIGILAERSPEMIIGMIGILKAGAACLLIDSQYSADQIRYQLEDSNTRILLTQLKLTPKIEFKGTVIDLMDPALYDGDRSNSASAGKPDNLIYLNYATSGTGKLVGVILEHRNLVNLINFEYASSNIRFNKVLQFATLSFALCYQEIFSTLLSGGELYIIDENVRENPDEFFKVIGPKKLETIFLPTAYLKAISSKMECFRRSFETVKHIIAVGDQLVITEQFREYLKRNKVSLHNHYYLPETQAVITLTMHPAENILEIPPIGKPINNTSVYILDWDGGLEPVGETGELYISGDSVGRGYLNQVELTNEKFIPNPFIPGELMYRTGDLARWLPDGNIELLGPIGRQVKFRGYRIEPGEIESRLINHEAVREAIVAAREDHSGNKYLCAYIVTGQELTVPELREYLEKVLPDYLIPAHFVRLEKLPLTTTGKIARNALVDSGKGPEPEMGFFAPQNETEIMLAGIWQEVLGFEEIGINDNFFGLGGDSLKAIQVVAQLRQWKIEVKDIIRHPTILELSRHVGAGPANKMIQSPDIIQPVSELPDVAERRLTAEYYFRKDGQWDQFVAILDCAQAPLYFILKQKTNINNPSELFLKSIDFHLCQNSDGAIANIDFRERPIGDGVFKTTKYTGTGTVALSQIEVLLDQGEMVLIQTYPDRLPFFNGFAGLNAAYTRTEALQTGHVFLAVWHDRDFLYYLDDPLTVNQKNFVPYELNKSIGMIRKDEIIHAFNLYVNYATIAINEAGFPNTQTALAMIKEIMENAITGYGKKTEERDGMIISYQKEALAKLVELCGQGRLSLKQKVDKLDLYGLMNWKFAEIWNRRTILHHCLLKFAPDLNRIYINNLLKLLDTVIKTWHETFYLMDDRYHQQKYLLDPDDQRYFIKLADLEEELVHGLERIDGTIP